MINSPMQLKSKIKNISKGDSNKSQALMRLFFMEKFLERLSMSNYKNDFILKGGILVASIVGVEVRSTMDIDASISGFDLDEETATKIINEIMDIDIGDNVSFEVIKETKIMEEFDYPGLRFTLKAFFGEISQAIMIDISTGDIITPAAIDYKYDLMLENRSIKLKSYNIETLLAEKLETIMSRSIANTRMRDFYDVHYLYCQKGKSIDIEILKNAFHLISQKRNTYNQFSNIDDIMGIIEKDENMLNYWNSYKENSYYVRNLTWRDVNQTIKEVFNRIK